MITLRGAAALGIALTHIAELVHSVQVVVPFEGEPAEGDSEIPVTDSDCGSDNATEWCANPRCKVSTYHNSVTLYSY